MEPTWPKLVEPFEKIYDRLTVVWGIISHLNSVKDSAELRSAIEEVQPAKVAFQLRLAQSKQIYNAFKAIRDSTDHSSSPSEAQKRIVDARIKDSILSGVSLEGEKRDRFGHIEQELENLSQKFEENVQVRTNKFERLITERNEIQGFPPNALEFASRIAASKFSCFKMFTINHYIHDLIYNFLTIWFIIMLMISLQGHANANAETGPWLITLNSESYFNVMRYAKNQSMRKEIYIAYINRASERDLNNTPIIDQILRLRLENAKLLGYENYAEVSFATKMANLEKAEMLLEELRIASWKAAVQEMEELKAFSRSQGAVVADELTHWDLHFWSNRLLESTYKINEGGKLEDGVTGCLPPSSFKCDIEDEGMDEGEGMDEYEDEYVYEDEDKDKDKDEEYEDEGDEEYEYDVMSKATDGTHHKLGKGSRQRIPSHHYPAGVYRLGCMNMGCMERSEAFGA